MIEILEGQEFKEKIPAGLPPGTRVANKTGDMVAPADIKARKSPGSIDNFRACPRKSPLSHIGPTTSYSFTGADAYVGLQELYIQIVQWAGFKAFNVPG